MIKRDTLTPCSGHDYFHRLSAVVRELDRADAALCNAWDERNDARWPRHSTDIKDMAPADDPRVVAAEAKIEAARAAWRAAHEKLVEFVGAPLELVCAVEDWRVSPWRQRARCTFPASHDGAHSFEIETAERQIEDEVLQQSQERRP